MYSKICSKNGGVNLELDRKQEGKGEEWHDFQDIANDRPKVGNGGDDLQ